MNNSVYSKKMENLRERVKIRLVNDAKDYNKYVCKPGFVSQKIFKKCFVAIHEINQSMWDFSVLHLSKLLRCEFHYKYIGRKYDNSANLLFIDTDSLVYEIETSYVYEDFYGDNLFDNFV